MWEVQVVFTYVFLLVGEKVVVSVGVERGKFRILKPGGWKWGIWKNRTALESPRR